MKYIYLTILLLASVALAVFIDQNDTVVQLTYFKWSSPHMWISVYMIASFLAGWIIAMLASFASGLRFRFRASGAERELRQVRAELEQLKSRELKAVSDEMGEGAGESSLPEERRTVSGTAEDGTLSWNENDPDAETAFTDSGGEEEK